MKESTIIKLLFAVTSILVFLTIGITADAASPREARLERTHTGLMQARDQIEKAIAWLESLMCSIGMEKYCPEPEPTVSTGHTVLVKFDVTTSVYTNRRQENDSTPCDSAGIVDDMNVCAAYDAGLHPIAVSQDLTPYPLDWGDKIKLTSYSLEPHCKALEKIYTVMDHMNERYKTRVDAFLKCNGDIRDDDYCMASVARARATGLCEMSLIKL